MQPTAIDSKSKNHHGERVAFIQACWHKDIVDQSRKGFVSEMIAQGYQESDIDVFEVGGAFEMPLHAKLLAKTLDAATGKLLDNNKSPSPKTGELDNRGSQFYLAMFWAQELANQTEDAELAAHFAKLAKALTDSEQQIVAELKTVQGKAVDIGGYYKADSDKCKAVMRPSPTLNAALKAARV